MFALALALAGCGQPVANDQPPVPPPLVSVAEMKGERVALSFAYPGRVAAFREVEVRARVGGILMARHYVEGARVKAGDVLFRIDPAVYEAELARAQAQLQQARAQLAQAERDEARTVALFDRQFASEKARDDAVSAVELAAAAVAAAEAQVKTATINLGYTTITAPIDGIAGLARRQHGSLIGTDTETSLLTRIVEVDPVHVNFAFNDDELNAILRIAGIDKTRLAGRLKVEVSTGTGEAGANSGSQAGAQPGSFAGTIDFIAPDLDPQTGNVPARAVIAGAGTTLRPGRFVRVAITGLALDNAIVVPQAAVMQNAKGKFVYVVDDKDKVASRPVVLGRASGQGWIVTSGLAPGDRVVTEGVVKVHAGAAVRIATDEPPKLRAANAAH